MYLAIDIGGSKTCIALFDLEGNLTESLKFPTAQDYEQFLSDLKLQSYPLLAKGSVTLCCTAVPGLLDREKGVVFALGNLPWKDKAILEDISNVLGGIPVIIENDSRLAGLGAAQPLKQTYKNILYLTISTGIGGALISDGKIVQALRDTEMGKIPVFYEGSLQHWEDFASGRAIVEKYHKLASEITDESTWQEIAKPLGYGVAIMSSIMQPDVIVFGGGAGQFAERFIPYVGQYMNDVLHPIAKRPDLLVAQNAEQVVIYGCFELAKSYAVSA